MSKKRTIDLGSRDRDANHKLLSSLVIPRPIAWVTSMSPSGQPNAAPFSYFNLFGTQPPMAIIGVGNRPDGSPKDTAANITATRHYVINLAEEPTGAAMNACATVLPPEQSELEAFGIATVPASCIDVPMIAKARANLECQLIEERLYGENRILVGEILAVHVAEDIYDAERNYILDAYQPLGRMSGARYIRTADRFKLERPDL